jgi:hypothetical protein
LIDRCATLDRPDVDVDRDDAEHDVPGFVAFLRLCLVGAVKFLEVQ